MKLHEIKDSLLDLEQETELLTDDNARRVCGKFLSITETLIACNLNAEELIQNLKNEVNVLKGEQGTPDIKPNKSDDYSSESDRATAEAEANPRVTVFRLSERKLKDLKDDRLPTSALNLLSSIKDKVFDSEEEFLKEVRGIIGKDKTDCHQDTLLKIARYKPRSRRKKNEFIQVDRTELLTVDGSDLPGDAKPCGYETKTVQNLVIQSDNVEFVRQRYYSPLLKKTFTPPVPRGWEGGFGPNIKAEILLMKYQQGMSEPKILETLRSHGCDISATYISNRLTFEKYMLPFIEERADIFRAALENSTYHQIDDTGCRVNGVNHYCQVLCNDHYTAYFTTKHKDRLTILDILREFKPRRYIFNEDTFRLLDIFNVSDKKIKVLKEKVTAREYGESEFQELLNELFTDPKKGRTTRRRIAEAAAIAQYHQDETVDVVNLLIADDAPQFKLLTFLLGLCWIHIGRHFKKLNPLVKRHKRILENFQKQFWQYYTELKSYKNEPNDTDKQKLLMKFDVLFSTETGYSELDCRITKTKAKKSELLVVLDNPQIPLHNNGSENGVRVQKRREDVSLQTVTESGTIAKDVMMSIVETCRKLAINVRDLIIDIIEQKQHSPRLGNLIRQLAKESCGP